MKRFVIKIIPLIDLLLMPFVYPSALLMKIIRRPGIGRMPLCKKALINVGVFPILNHYYQPQFDYSDLKVSLSEDRNLPGIDWNIAGQLEFVKSLVYSGELSGISSKKQMHKGFYFNNGTFESGDAEYWYQLIRAVKPKRIFEVGSGNSTLMALKAIERNRKDDPRYKCNFVCIEPYEMPWLEEEDVSVIRSKVEDVDISFFSKLKENDILFIDSSHIIRPQGDILFEYLEILPSLNNGVIVHVHDIFSPKNYLSKWIKEGICFWNEQYLLEAFLTNNHNWKIFGALNYLHHNHYDKLKAVAPYLTPDREPGSFYIQKII